MRLLGGGHPADPENYCTVCHHDGGKSLRGIAHPNYQGKGYSRYVPRPMGPAVEAFLSQPDPLNLLESIATWESRADQLLRSLEKAGDPGELWQSVDEEWRELWRSTELGRIKDVELHRQKIGELISQGLSIVRTWIGIRNADEMKVKLVAAEDRRRDRQRGYMTAEQVRFQNWALSQAVVESLDTIKDPELKRSLRRQIGERFISIIGIPVIPGPAARG